MLVDLGRNDLGAVSTTGSVRVDELMVIERYSHVMHIVSNVTSELRDDRATRSISSPPRFPPAPSRGRRKFARCN